MVLGLKRWFIKYFDFGHKKAAGLHFTFFPKPIAEGLKLCKVKSHKLHTAQCYIRNIEHVKKFELKIIDFNQVVKNSIFSTKGTPY